MEHSRRPRHEPKVTVVIATKSVASSRKGARMSFADPQTVTIDSVAQAMPRVGSGPRSGTFQGADGLHKLEVSHTNSGANRNRRVIRLTQSKITTDPYNSDRNIPVSMSTFLVVDSPVVGFSNAELKLVVDGFVAYLAASSGSKVTQLLGGEQ